MSEDLLEFRQGESFALVAVAFFFPHAEQAGFDRVRNRDAFAFGELEDELEPVQMPVDRAGREADLRLEKILGACQKLIDGPIRVLRAIPVARRQSLQDRFVKLEVTLRDILNVGDACCLDEEARLGGKLLPGVFLDVIAIPLGVDTLNDCDDVRIKTELWPLGRNLSWGRCLDQSGFLADVTVRRS